MIFLLFSSLISACTIWEHHWRLLHEERTYKPSTESFELWKAWYKNTYKKEPRPVKIYEEGKGEALVPFSVASSGQTVLSPSQYEEYTDWKVDESLLPIPVLRWECMVRTNIRWVSISPEREVENIDEQSLCYGWTQTMALWPMIFPIIGFQRINSIDSTVDLFSLISVILPGTDIASSSYSFD